MKILVAIEGQGLDHKVMGDSTLRWASRAGYDLRIFIKNRQMRKYLEVLADANYHWYLGIDHTQIITNHKPMPWALEHGYDLLLRLPADLLNWRNRATMERQVFLYAEAVGKARLKFAQKPGKRVHRFANGAIMERVREG